MDGGAMRPNTATSRSFTFAFASITLSIYVNKFLKFINEEMKLRFQLIRESVRVKMCCVVVWCCEVRVKFYDSCLPTPQATHISHLTTYLLVLWARQDRVVQIVTSVY